jgi:hypothetical protein
LVTMSDSCWSEVGKGVLFSTSSRAETQPKLQYQSFAEGTQAQVQQESTLQRTWQSYTAHLHSRVTDARQIVILLSVERTPLSRSAECSCVLSLVEVDAVEGRATREEPPNWPYCLT